MRWVLCLAVWCGGCGSLQYQGWSPSVRAFREEPDLDDVYVGADAEFALTERPGARGPGVARGQPLDAWNTPVAYQPLAPSPVAHPVREASTSAEPLLDGN